MKLSENLWNHRYWRYWNESVFGMIFFRKVFFLLDFNKYLKEIHRNLIKNINLIGKIKLKIIIIFLWKLQENKR